MLALNSQPTFNCNDLVKLFNETFETSHNTILVAGGSEPLYLPAKNGECAKIIFAYDYFSSALHEISHWLIAGEARRRLEDYGYWYSPDGRNVEQQQAFEKVEVTPQALEWILTKACGRLFRLSLDNLNGQVCSSKPFAEAVHYRVGMLTKTGLNKRAEHMRKVLCDFYQTPSELEETDFHLKEIYTGDAL